MNESLAYQGRKLKRNNLVNACYARDGTVTIKINECSKTIKIHHMNDLLELFPNFDFEDEPFHDQLCMMHLLMYQVSQCTEWNLVPLEFVVF